MRMALIVIVSVVALIVPNFAFLTNVVGAVCCSAVAFIIPVLLYNEQFKNTITWSRWVVNCGVILFGTFGGVMSLRNSIYSLEN